MTVHERKSYTANNIMDKETHERMLSETTVGVILKQF